MTSELGVMGEVEVLRKQFSVCNVTGKCDNAVVTSDSSGSRQADVDVRETVKRQYWLNQHKSTRQTSGEGTDQALGDVTTNQSTGDRRKSKKLSRDARKDGTVESGSFIYNGSTNVCKWYKNQNSVQSSQTDSQSNTLASQDDVTTSDYYKSNKWVKPGGHLEVRATDVTNSNSTSQSATPMSSSTSTTNSDTLESELLSDPYEGHIYSEIGSIRRTPIRTKPKAKRKLVWDKDAGEISSSQNTPQKTQGRRKGMSTFMKTLEKTPRLVELTCVPWGEQEVLCVLREGRTAHLSSFITVEMMQYLSHILHRPLVRISKEAQRLCSSMKRCTRVTIQSASKIILSRMLYESCIQAGMKALTLYGMSVNSFKESKSHHCELKFSVGKFHRWMLNAAVGLRVEETAAVFLAACMESLLEDIVLLALDNCQLGQSPLRLGDLEEGIRGHPELWGLLSPYAHLVASRDASGRVSLPRYPTHSDPSSSPEEASFADSSLSASSGFSSGGSFSSASLSSSERGSLNRRCHSLSESLDASLSVTCVASLSELSCLVTEIMQHQYRSCGCQGNSSSHPLINWSTEALHVLYHFLRCTQGKSSSQLFGIQLSPEKMSRIQAPVGEWVRVAVSHAQHRHCHLVDADDVRQAARLLLPSADCPPRRISHVVQPECWERLEMSSDDCASRVKSDVAFSMLCTGRSDLLPHALTLLGTSSINTVNEQGLTPLMCACLHGDEAMVQMLINAGADPNIQIGADVSSNNINVMPDVKKWSALTCAALLGHLTIVQLLIEHGAHVEGCEEKGEPNPCPTPLQLAAAAGHYDLVCLLLLHNADPYLTSAPGCSMSFARSRGCHNAFTLAAMHGHRYVLRRLIAHIPANTSDTMTLEEMLEEVDTPPSSPPPQSDETRQSNCYYNQQFPSHGNKSNNHGNNTLKCHSNQEDEDDEGHLYMTIEDVMDEEPCNNNHKPYPDHHGNLPQQLSDSNHFILAHQESAVNHSRQSSGVNSLSGHSLKSMSRRFSKMQFKVFQEAMYHAAENGFLDIALELRSLGVPWSLHSWSQCLWAAHSLRRKPIVQCLLKDFLASSRQEDVNEEFIYECLPLMLEIFRGSKQDDVNSQQLANILSSLYGDEPPHFFQGTSTSLTAKIDPIYVNNPELSDVRFLVEGKTFYAHKLLLLNVSTSLRNIIENATRDQTGVPTIPIPDIKYSTFELMMMFLYRGHLDGADLAAEELFELLLAARIYQIEALLNCIEKKCCEKVNLYNCTTMYKLAKVHHADKLLTYCEGFFLLNLTRLLNDNDSFRKLLFSSKLVNFDLVNGLLATLSERLEDRLSQGSFASTLV